MPLAFFGTADFSVPSLEALLDNGFNVAAVITKPDTPRGRGRLSTPPLVKEIASRRSIPVVQPKTKDDLESALASFGTLDAAVVVAYGLILPRNVLDYFDGKLINVHASLLPRWRGPSPIEAAILHGEDVTGITLMRLEAAMDSGPVYKQASIPLDGTETRLSLHGKLAGLGAKTLVDYLPDILTERCLPVAQTEADVTYCPLINKKDGIIDWNQPADVIERQIRAYLGWPGSRTRLFEREVTITSADVAAMNGQPGTVLSTPENELYIYCAKGALKLNSLIPAGKREMAAADFIRGHGRPH